MAVMEFAKQWIAGTEIEDAISVAQDNNTQGKGAIITYLGEYVKEEELAEDAALVYIKLMEEMRKNEVRGAISVKPTQLGLLIGKKVFVKNYEAILKEAEANGIFVWLDMENFENIQDSIDVYLSQLETYREIGISLQAKVHRTASDIKTLVKDGANVRLEKGYYVEVEGETYETKDELADSYMEHMRYLFANSDSFALTFEEPKILKLALELEKRHKKRPGYVFLMGVAEKMSDRLAKADEDVSTYIPFGRDWLGYMMRRFRQEGNLLYFTKALAKYEEDS
jgi:proline dehydrogenase